MPITEPEWLSISRFVEKIVKQIIGKRDDYFITGKVLKVDEKNRCIFMEEFGDQPIPIVAFDSMVKYYDTSDSGVEVKTAVATIVMPKRGDSVLVAREMGVRRLPRALGVIQGKNWIVSEVDE